MDAAYIQARRRAMPRHATPRHAVRIIKRNYCLAVVNNALLLKRVPATARGYFVPCRLCRKIARTGFRCVSLSFPRHSSFFRDWPWLDLALSWRSDRARGNQLCEARKWHLRLAAISRLPKAAKNHILARSIVVRARIRVVSRTWDLAQLSALRDAARLFLC